ncbi:hypothetical protein IC229_27970 [Spirosoma sp. BT702]|uniref:Uncharacterized protein n=1 Tax=Spirosoma profusum TaxID=2771354 RepID=A0A926Y5D2_9BACT|nr:hypothetical protein [Spirosoma profusum]MBD2704510.1 hypothetical protein [Spirosoma profusum]
MFPDKTGRQVPHGETHALTLSSHSLTLSSHFLELAQILACFDVANQSIMADLLRRFNTYR